MRFPQTYFSLLVTDSHRGHAPFDLLRVEICFSISPSNSLPSRPHIHFPPFPFEAAAKGIPFQSGLTRV